MDHPIAIVTGGLRGLGRAMALGLAREGHEVLAVGHIEADIAEITSLEVWAKDCAGTGLTINIVNPGAGANTPGMADEMRAASREGRAARLVEPDEMVPPLLWVVSPAADQVNGYRFDANLWDPALPPAEAARRAGRPAGFVLHPEDGVPAIGQSP